MFTFSQKLVFSPSQHHRKSAPLAAANTSTEIKLSDAITGITIIDVKAKAVLKVATEHV